MQAVVVYEPGRPEQLELADLPKPRARPGHVVVRVEASGVNPVDASNRANPSWAGIEAPYVVGYEFAGWIDEVGDGVTRFSSGDAVWGLCPVRGTRWGTYAEYVEVDATWVARRPSGLEPVEAAAIPLTGSTALQLLDRLGLRSGESLLVHGAAGGVGSLLVQLARMNGIRIAASSSQTGHSLLRELGADVILDREREDVVAAAVHRLGPLDAIADLVGDGLLVRSLSGLKDGGRAGSIVELRGDFEEAIDRNMTLHGVLVQPDSLTLDRLADAVERGSLRAIVDRVFDPGSITQAHHRVESGHGQGRSCCV